MYILLFVVRRLSLVEFSAHVLAVSWHAIQCITTGKRGSGTVFLLLFPTQHSLAHWRPLPATAFALGIFGQRLEQTKTKIRRIHDDRQYTKRFQSISFWIKHENLWKLKIQQNFFSYFLQFVFKTLFFINWI